MDSRCAASHRDPLTKIVVTCDAPAVTYANNVPMCEAHDLERARRRLRIKEERKESGRAEAGSPDAPERE